LSPGGQPLGSFVDRLLAYLIDAAVLTAVGLVFAVPGLLILFVVVGPDAFTAAEPDPFALLVPLLLFEAAFFAVILVIAYVYYVELQARSGQTLGKRAMRLRVVPIDPGSMLTRRDCFRRYLVQFVAGSLVPFFGYLDGLWQLWDKPYQQCLHDKWGRTVVVKLP
jgi:uncharacterized RDD family membrane protein YckC